MAGALAAQCLSHCLPMVVLLKKIQTAAQGRDEALQLCTQNLTSGHF